MKLTGELPSSAPFGVSGKAEGGGWFIMQFEKPEMENAWDLFLQRGQTLVLTLDRGPEFFGALVKGSPFVPSGDPAKGGKIKFRIYKDNVDDVTHQLLDLRGETFTLEAKPSQERLFEDSDDEDDSGQGKLDV